MSNSFATKLLVAKRASFYNINQCLGFIYVAQCDGNSIFLKDLARHMTTTKTAVCNSIALFRNLHLIDHCRSKRG
jgi:hypothetical protein